VPLQIAIDNVPPGVRQGRREPNALAKSSRRARDELFRLDWRSFGAAWLHSRPVMSRQQHELAVTAEQGMLERHFDTITLRSQAATISLDAATWPECMLIARDPFASKGSRAAMVCSLVVEEITSAVASVELLVTGLP